MRTIFEPATPGAVSPTRLLLLPAAYTGPDDFIREGFVQAARERELPIDLVFVELKLPHLTDRTILHRLRHEVVLPARAEGCSSVWLGGISLGGFIAISYAERYPQEVDGLCLLAPYLGNHIVVGEIERANGVEGWTPTNVADDDDERRVWRYIKGQRERRACPLHLGYGSEDRFADSHRLMATALASENVDVVPGKHEWPAWRCLWDNFLDTRFRMT
jgi:hypothetical protein